METNLRVGILMGLSEKMPTTDTASSLGAETADQSCGFNVRCIRPYMENEFPSPVKGNKSFFKKLQNHLNQAFLQN